MTDSSNTTGASAASFNPFTAGIEFMQQFSKNMTSGNAAAGLAGAAIPGIPQMPTIPGMPNWAMPTMDPAELDKRITELKTVLFWLEQNTNALKSTVQALEVQKLTLETLQSMREGMNSAANHMAESAAEVATAVSPSAKSRSKNKTK